MQLAIYIYVCEDDDDGDDDDDDDDDEEEEEEDDEDDSDDEILLSLSAILFNNPGKWRLSLYVGHPGSGESQMMMMKIGKNIQDNDEDHGDYGVWSRECNGSNVLP